MPALTDTVMAAVPVDDADIGSAVNDVSRELGGALGIAITGAFVNRAYAQNVEDELAGVASAEVVEAASGGIGVATIVAADLPADVAAAVLAGANTAFVDAVAVGFFVGIAFMVLAALVAAALLPWRMREEQAAEHRSEQLRQPDAFVAGVPGGAARARAAVLPGADRPLRGSTASATTSIPGCVPTASGGRPPGIALDVATTEMQSGGPAT